MVDQPHFLIFFTASQHQRSQNLNLILYSVAQGWYLCVPMESVAHNPRPQPAIHKQTSGSINPNLFPRKNPPGTH